MSRCWQSLLQSPTTRVWTTVDGQGRDHGLTQFFAFVPAGDSSDHSVGGVGPVNPCLVVATEAIFSQDQAARVPCSYATPVSANAGLRKMAPSLRVAPEIWPGGVARRSFGTTKHRSPRLAWPDFRPQRGDHTSGNRH